MRIKAQSQIDHTPVIHAILSMQLYILCAGEHFEFIPDRFGTDILNMAHIGTDHIGAVMLICFFKQLKSFVIGGCLRFDICKVFCYFTRTAVFKQSPQCSFFKLPLRAHLLH